MSRHEVYQRYATKELVVKIKEDKEFYREKRKGAREANALIGGTIDMFGKYLGDKDWLIKENSNMQKSINGLNNYVREAFTKMYWRATES